MAIVSGFCIMGGVTGVQGLLENGTTRYAAIGLPIRDLGSLFGSPKQIQIPVNAALLEWSGTDAHAKIRYGRQLGFALVQKCK
ncbi:hypothetical protein BD289DRAFT_82974 [Coniella lustricola]|uniref:Uncharacterized protein n=1 Tax=Coniella lustricola TaxID=2025994 RepID=A0A2T3AHA8_9PEZI|nr:hypothetical protein BD289DRAFT_82974 [Coniella lustricola]